jgi:hypothetical protein
MGAMDEDEIEQVPIVSPVIATFWWALFLHAVLSSLLDRG